MAPGNARRTRYVESASRFFAPPCYSTVIAHPAGQTRPSDDTHAYTRLRFRRIVDAGLRRARGAGSASQEAAEQRSTTGAMSMTNEAPVTSAAADRADGRPGLPEHELSAAAREAVGAGDIDAVLQRFADRARRLAGGDYAAVATVDSEGRTTWRAVSGHVSDVWRTT